jgi:hypothetical protein
VQTPRLLDDGCGVAQQARIPCEAEDEINPVPMGEPLNHLRCGTMAVPPDAQQEVRLRIATTTGRQLIDYTGNATGQEHCPGGAGCVHCQAIVVDIDPADAGQAVDSSDPARAGHCGP